MSLNLPRKTNTEPNSPGLKAPVTPVRNRSTERKQSFSTTENASLQIVLGLRGSGKTSFALDLIEQKNPVILCPGATNPDIKAYQWVYNDDKGLKWALEKKNRVVKTKFQNLDLFSYLEGDGLVLMLDDVRMILTHKDLRSALERWIGGFRWRHQKIVITTHRPIKDMVPLAYDLATAVYWVGPLRDREEADNLWQHRDQDWDRQEYYSKLKSLVKYDYLTRNVTESVFQIKAD